MNSADFHISALHIQHISLSRGNFLLFRYFDSKKLRIRNLKNKDWVAPYIWKSIQ